MQYATFSTSDDHTPRLGVVRADRMMDVHQLLADPSAPRTLVDLIHAGLETWRTIAERLGVRLADAASAGGHPLDEVHWHAPIPRPLKNIVCLGLNYVRHVRETTSAGKPIELPEVPIFFTKATTSVTGPFDPIPWDRSATTQVDYEAELGVIIGTAGKNIPRARTLQSVFGYTAINDVSARDLQFVHKQWFKGKSLDGFCPMGPVVVTPDEFGDPQNKRIRLRVNGETRQDASTADMFFGVETIIEHLSRGMTLDPGDVIATGTPEGVGLGRTPPEYLQDGDVVEVEIEGIGVLRNRLEAV